MVSIRKIRIIILVSNRILSNYSIRNFEYSHSTNYFRPRAFRLQSVHGMHQQRTVCILFSLSHQFSRKTTSNWGQLGPNWPKFCVFIDKIWERFGWMVMFNSIWGCK